MRLAASYDSESMKPALCLLYAVMLCGLLCSSLQAQAPASTSQQAPAPYIPPQNPTPPPGPVPISEEPRHRLVLQNDYYSPGHFAHIVRTDSGMPFQNVTIELVRPQGTVKNLCKEVLPGAPTDCPEKQPAADNSKAKKNQPARAADDDPYFETDEMRVDLHKVSSGNDYVDATPKTDALLVALTNANLDANLGGEHVSFLHGGDVLWMPAGQRRRIVDFLGTNSSFLLISFKDSAPAPKTQ